MQPRLLLLDDGGGTKRVVASLAVVEWAAYLERGLTTFRRDLNRSGGCSLHSRILQSHIPVAGRERIQRQPPLLVAEATALHVRIAREHEAVLGVEDGRRHLGGQRLPLLGEVELQRDVDLALG